VRVVVAALHIANFSPSHSGTHVRSNCLTYAPHLRWPARCADGAHGSRRGVALRAATHAVPTASAHLQGVSSPAQLSLLASCAGFVTDHQRSTPAEYTAGALNPVLNLILCAGPPAHYIGSGQGEGIGKARQLCVYVCIYIYIYIYIPMYVCI